jgi:hypothetical protein
MIIKKVISAFQKLSNLLLGNFPTLMDSMIGSIIIDILRTFNHSYTESVGKNQLSTLSLSNKFTFLAYNISYGMGSKKKRLVFHTRKKSAIPLADRLQDVENSGYKNSSPTEVKHTFIH